LAAIAPPTAVKKLVEKLKEFYTKEAEVRRELVKLRIS
jgi:hypothetical protein